MQRRYEISDERGNRIEHMFPKTKTRRPGKDLRRSNCLQQCALEGPSRTFSAHGRQSIPVSANGVSKELFLKCLNI